MKNNICGFIELNGELVKISTIEDLKSLVERLGNAFSELTEKDYNELCKHMQGCYATDDCNVYYSTDWKRLLFAPISSEEYIIKTGTTIIAKYAFNWHWYQINGLLYNNKYIHKKEINNLLIPDSVIAIGAEAFMDNGCLSNVIMSSNLQYIGTRAFSGCWKMSDFTIPSSLKYIESEAFDGCWNAFTELVIPESVKHIGSHAFRNCKRIEKVMFSSEIENIGSGIFDGCEKLAKIVVPKGSYKKFCDQLPFFVSIITENQDETGL